MLKRQPVGQPSQHRRGLSRADGSVAAVALAVVLVIGIQLGGVPWRYRKQLWQLQGACIGALVGYLVGRLSSAGLSDP